MRRPPWYSLPALAAALAVLSAAPTAADTALAPGVFERLRKAVFQIKTVLTDPSAKTSYGTAFAVRRDGLLVSNYHVVAAAVQEPERHRLLVLLPDRAAPAEVIGVDVVHDLALLKLEQDGLPAVTLARQGVRQGETLYSIGWPLDLNLAIAPATYNGVIAAGIYETIHLSAPLNPGMSGGPTVNGRGELVGVNVSHLQQAQNVSFLVPAHFVKALLGRAEGEEPRRQIEEQLDSAQRALTEQLLAQPAAVFENAWRAPAPPPYMQCWQDESKERQLRWLVKRCSLGHSAHPWSGQNSRGLAYFKMDYQLLQDYGMGSLRFLSAQQAAYGAYLSSYTNESGETLRRRYTDAFCIERRVRSSRGLPLQVGLCARELVDYPGLFEASFRLAPLTRGATLIITVGLSGFSMPSLERVLRRYLESLEPTADVSN